MAVKGHLAIGMALGDLTGRIVTMPDVFAAAKTGDIFQRVFVVNGVAVGLLHLWALVEHKGRKTSQRYGFQPVAVGGSPPWRVVSG